MFGDWGLAIEGLRTGIGDWELGLREEANANSTILFIFSLATFLYPTLCYVVLC